MDWLLEIGGQLERKVDPGSARAGNAPYDVRERACKDEQPRTTVAYQDRRSRVLEEPGSASKLSSQ